MKVTTFMKFEFPTVGHSTIFIYVSWWSKAGEFEPKHVCTRVLALNSRARNIVME